jgi:hypothetical protein
MAYHSHPVLDRVASPFWAVGELFATLATTRPRFSDLDRLSRMSDDDLAARGTTRQNELQRILGAGALL